jgi:hypothetical protein
LTFLRSSHSNLQDKPEAAEGVNTMRVSRVLAPLVCLAISPVGFAHGPPAVAAGAESAAAQGSAVVRLAQANQPQVPQPPPLPNAAQPQPPPLPVTPQAVFYVERGGQPVGPLSLDQVLEQIRGNQITRQTQVWRSGDPGWVAANDQPELRAAFTAQPPPLTGVGLFREILTGTWQYERTLANGTRVAGQVRYQSDGRFTGVQQFAMPGLPLVTQPLSGSWDVQAIGASDRFTVTLTTVGAPPSSFVVRVINDTTLYNETDGIYARKTGS